MRRRYVGSLLVPQEGGGVPSARQPGKGGPRRGQCVHGIALAADAGACRPQQRDEWRAPSLRRLPPTGLRPQDAGVVDRRRHELARLRVPGPTALEGRVRPPILQWQTLGVVQGVREEEHGYVDQDGHPDTLEQLEICDAPEGDDGPRRQRRQGLTDFDDHLALPGHHPPDGKATENEGAQHRPSRVDQPQDTEAKDERHDHRQPRCLPSEGTRPCAQDGKVRRYARHDQKQEAPDDPIDRVDDDDNAK
mmetsp:Transcript_86598/g.250065  ORF Transcript_86598/g.250065 Transcript_86598/m.250065 type:complete len:249 (+) Transcript_86598:2000-2746(+)